MTCLLSFSRNLYVVKWLPSSLDKTSSFPSRSLFYVGKSTALCGRKRVDKSSLPIAIRKEAQAALLEYLHITRGLPFADADSVSKNSPQFLERLLEEIKAATGQDVGQMISRHLRFNPINEFEPFFESMGFKPSECIPLLPHDVVFLSDDDLLLTNYRVLRNYGIPGNNIGKIYKTARTVFHYNDGVLASKLAAYEELGLSQGLVAKLVASSPGLLVGSMNVDFLEVLHTLQKARVEHRRIESYLTHDSCDWRRMLAIVYLFRKMLYDDEELCELINNHLGILFEESGHATCSLIGFLSKLGFSMNDLHSFFQQFPQISVVRFVLNLRRCFLFFNEIDMEMTEIVEIISKHPSLLGSCSLKKTRTILAHLNSGKRVIREMLQMNPQELKKWVMGSKIEPAPLELRQISKLLKTRFLLDLGIVKNSFDIEKALKNYRGSGREMKERFDCIIQAGVDEDDLCRMIRAAPYILNLTKDVIEMKIDFLKNVLGFSIRSLVSHPSCLVYSTQRVQLRFVMYNWIRENVDICPMKALSTIIAWSDQKFVLRLVKLHPKGPEVWQQFKREIYF